MGTFTTDDLDTAIAFYESIDDENAKRLFDNLVDHPDEQRTAAELQQILGFAEHRDVASATFYLGTLAATLDRARPWAEGQVGYRMPEALAALFWQARHATSETGAMALDESARRAPR